MTDKYCPLRFREYDSNPHDQRCIGEYCAWFDKCSQSHGEPIYWMPYGNMEPGQVIATEEPQEPREVDENANDVDTREKLEADVQKFSQVYYTSNLLVYDKVIELLDRQAAITERTAVIAAKEAGKVLREKIAELQEKVQELERDNEKLKSELDARMYWVNLADRIDELEAENARLSSDELHWHSEADFWKRKYELICKALIDLNRNYVHVEDEGMA